MWNFWQNPYRKLTTQPAISKLILFVPEPNQLAITPDSARKITANYYDILRSLIEAMAALKGFKIYSHEGFTAFLKDEGKNYMAKKFDTFRLKRNRIEYFGSRVSVEEAISNAKTMKELIQKLRRNVSEEVKKP